jgi:pantoate--beta-alanine ligase
VILLRSKAELRTWRKSLGTATLGFVPTMGALHAGHISLVALSRARCEKTLVSIFVNPLQFGPNEDLSHYPRPLEKDLALLEEARTDAVFLPEPSDLTPPGQSTFVTEEQVSQPLCGAMRPGHFRGVTTIVNKLLNLAQPDVAFFGQKDAQQCAVLERMVRDLDMPIEIVRGPTVREPDGLALSSRNTYLSEAERAQAPAIHRSFLAIEKLVHAGERRVHELEHHGRSALEAAGPFQVQYYELRDPVTLERLTELGPRGALIAVAAMLGRTRLIDNWFVQPQIL